MSLEDIKASLANQPKWVWVVGGGGIIVVAFLMMRSKGSSTQYGVGQTSDFTNALSGLQDAIGKLGAGGGGGGSSGGGGGGGSGGGSGSGPHDNPTPFPIIPKHPVLGIEPGDTPRQGTTPIAHPITGTSQRPTAPIQAIKYDAPKVVATAPSPKTLTDHILNREPSGVSSGAPSPKTLTDHILTREPAPTPKSAPSPKTLTDHILTREPPKPPSSGTSGRTRVIAL